MTPLARLRVAATLLGIAAAALRIWSYHLRFDINPWLTTALAIAIPAGIYIALLWPLRHPPKTLSLRDAAFAVEPSPSLGAWIIICGFWAGPLLTLGDWGSIAVVVTLFALAHLLWRIGVRLTPEGVEIRTLFTRRIAWDAIAPGHPDNAVPGQRHIELHATDHGQWKRHTIGLSTRHIGPAVLAWAIRHYAQHPEHRAAIGTQEELDRLNANMAQSTDLRTRL